jgi:hypothetical protein
MRSNRSCMRANRSPDPLKLVISDFKFGKYYTKRNNITGKHG